MKPERATGSRRTWSLRPTTAQPILGAQRARPPTRRLCRPRNDMQYRKKTATIMLGALLGIASLAAAQGNTPRRPSLEADADTNHWQAYYDAGSRFLSSDPRKAADAFYWA